MSDDDPKSPDVLDHLAALTEKGTQSGGSRKSRRLEITAIVIAVILSVGVVVAALDMKFEADQARWQQRQTCLDWYRLQAEYGLGPWYEKLPAAAADCGGDKTDSGVPTVPGGTEPAVDESDIPGGPSTSTTGPAATPSTGS